jgi:CheY-like chemotaxis protein
LGISLILGSALAWDYPHVPQTVLIVDDHAGFRGFARRLLEAGGYTVVGEAEDGASALAAVGELRPELVLLDVMLPDTDGFAVAERLAGNGEEPVVVLTSSREAADFGQRLEQTSAHGFIHKDELSGAALARLTADGP